MSKAQGALFAFAFHPWTRYWVSVNEEPSRLEKGFSWWHPKVWKPRPPAAAEKDRNEGVNPGEWPQGDKKWRLNNPKKRNPGQ